MPQLHALFCSTAQNMNCPISTTAFTLHCKTTAHNSTTTILQRFSVLQRYYFVHSISTPRYYNIIGQHPSQYSAVHQEKSSSWYKQSINQYCSRHKTSSSAVLLQTSFDCISARSALVLYKVCTSASTVVVLHSTESALELHPSMVKNVLCSFIVLINALQVSNDSVLAQQNLGSKSSGKSQGTAANSRSKTSWRRAELYCSGLVCGPLSTRGNWSDLTSIIPEIEKHEYLVCLSTIGERSYNYFMYLPDR